MISDNEGDCQNPNCTRDATETYRGGNGNTLRLCERHYYQIVSGGNTVNIDYSTDREPLTPFWDSGIRCDSTTNTEPFDLPDDTGVNFR